MLILYISLFVFVYLAIRTFKKSGLGLAFFIFILYAASYAAAISILSTGAFQYRKPEPEWPLLFLLLALLFFLFPFVNDGKPEISTLFLPSKRILERITKVTTVVSLMSVLFFLPRAFGNLNVGLDNINDVRDAVHEGGTNLGYFGFFMGAATYFFIIQIVLYFVRIVIIQKNDLLSYLILVSSFSFPLYTLSYMGRDGVIFWALSFVSCFFVFRNYIAKKERKFLLKIGMAFGLLAFIIFIAISIGRFVVGGGGELDDALLIYLGCGPINFADEWNMHFPYAWGAGLLSLDSFNSFTNIYYSRGADFMVNSFSTFVGTFLQNFPPLVILLLALLNNKWISFYRNGKAGLEYLLLYFLLGSIYMEGVFYFLQKGKIAMTGLTLMLFMILYIRKFPKHKYQLKQFN